MTNDVNLLLNYYKKQAGGGGKLLTISRKLLTNMNFQV